MPHPIFYLQKDINMSDSTKPVTYPTIKSIIKQEQLADLFDEKANAMIDKLTINDLQDTNKTKINKIAAVLTNLTDLFLWYTNKDTDLSKVSSFLIQNLNDVEKVMANLKTSENGSTRIVKLAQEYANLHKAYRNKLYDLFGQHVASLKTTAGTSKEREKELNSIMESLIKAMEPITLKEIDQVTGQPKPSGSG
jgi:hypothetical protein